MDQSGNARSEKLAIYKLSRNGSTLVGINALDDSIWIQDTKTLKWIRVPSVNEAQFRTVAVNFDGSKIYASGLGNTGIWLISNS